MTTPAQQAEFQAQAARLRSRREQRFQRAVEALTEALNEGDAVYPRGLPERILDSLLDSDVLHQLILTDERLTDFEEEMKKIGVKLI